MKNKKTNLDNLLEHLLLETQPPIRPGSMADFAPVEEKQVSLDQAIDRFLVQYEREAIPTSQVFESAKVDNLLGYLFEQDEEDTTDNADEEGIDLGGDTGGDTGDAGPDAGLDLGLPGEDTETPAPDGEETPQPVVNTPQINLEDFARNIARLVNNFQSLIDYKTILLNRVEAYMAANYDQRTALEMMETLSQQYDLKPVDITTKRVDEPEYPEPHAGVTGPVGG